MARCVLGQNIQGIDHAYTLQGWIKGVNSPSLLTTKDIGADGQDNVSPAADAFGYTLNYYDGDYKAVELNTNSEFQFEYENNTNVDIGNSLFNGNIRNMSVGIKDITEANISYKYQYDQLHRLLSAQSSTPDLNAPNYNFGTNKYQWGF